MWPIAAILSFEAIIALTTAYYVADETLALTESSFYPMGYPEEDYGVSRLLYKYKIMNPEALKALISEEWQIYNKFKNLKAKTSMDSEWGSSSFLQSVHEYMGDFEESSLRLVQSYEDRTVTNNIGAQDIIAGNMLTVFLTVRRFVHYFQYWLMVYENEINMTALEGSAFSKLKIYEMKNGPDVFDFRMAIMGIIMNQFHLDLKAEDIAAGVIAGIQMSTKLRAVHCIDIGVYAFATAMYPIAIEWLELVVKKINEGDSSVSLDFASQWLHTAIRKHDDCWDPLASNALSSMFFESQLNLSSSTTVGLKWSKQVKSNEQIEFQDRVFLESELPYYLHWNTCQGKMTQSILEKSKLFCWYEHQIHPSFRIGPIKAELHSTFPRLEIVQYYELISDKAVDRLKQNVQKLSPSLYGTKEKMYFNPKKQYSVIGYPSDKNRDRSKLENLITRVSGLKSYVRGGSINPRSQIVAYIPGGHSLVHEDWDGLDSTAGIHSEHWRIASFMVYLEEPQKGGETTFPYALVAVPPVKGSGVLAHNLLRSGVRDRHAPHGGCPVVMGNKYVWIKDIPYVNQEHMQCDTDPDARIEILVNGKSKVRRPEPGSNEE